MRKPAKIAGTAPGNTMWRPTWRSLAPITCAICTSLGSSARTPDSVREIDDEEHHRRNQRDLGFDADAEPQDEQRREGELGRAIAADHERIEDRHHDRLPAQQERQQHRRHAADDAADHRLVDGVAAVEDQFAVEQRRNETRRHRPRRAEPVVAEPQAAALPCREQDDQDDQPVEPDDANAYSSPSASCPWICRTGTNRSSTRGALAITPCSSR